MFRYPAAEYGLSFRCVALLYWWMWRVVSECLNTHNLRLTTQKDHHCSESTSEWHNRRW